MILTNQSLHDIDNALNDSVSCSDTSDDEQSINEGLTTNSETRSVPLLRLNYNKSRFHISPILTSHKHSLTNSCVLDILNLFSQALLTSLPNHLSKSYHVLTKEFCDYSGSITLHRNYGYCSRLIPSNSFCEIPECQMENVGESAFIQVIIDKQLQTLFSGKNSTIASYSYNMIVNCKL